ncbi:hypothetical protein [Clostridium sp. ZS2-4]|uniref:hypothetical protein n=1 Tax=Clostridium sp. ZS2-4 TaxID=2987703 RepID=UPI00227CC9AB|nr:hypothetical protein [Clostridium sp. ZS2-4]MCY6356051.1 hypothetical protein [Clostridium sp. ZS2-4]
MKKIILILAIVIFSLTGCSSQKSINKINNSSSTIQNESKSQNNEEKIVIGSNDSVKEFLPNKPMIKLFNGDFENGGRVEVVDKIIENKYQIKSVNTGTGGVGVYEVKENEIRKVYGVGETEVFEESYLNKEANSNDLIILKAINILFRNEGYDN